MSFNLFKRITTEMREAGVQEIGCFFLGESMMNPELLIKAITWCKQELKFPYVFLTTNASLADPDIVKRCMAAGLDSLKFSVNAHNEKQFEEIMGVHKKLYYKALENIKAAYKVREDGEFNCGLYASSIYYDEDQKQDIQPMLDECIVPFVDEHYWLPLYSMSMFATQREEELGYRPIAGNQGRLGALRDPLPCWTAFTEGHVRADGGLSACCFDSAGQWEMGDLEKQSFMEAWNSKKFQNLRAAHLEKDVSKTICKDCIAYS
jgi:radical SAM protein with 4Fe4S-binding SPASM domain